jgi:hypothetical protein
MKAPLQLLVAIAIETPEYLRSVACTLHTEEWRASTRALDFA